MDDIDDNPQSWLGSANTFILSILSPIDQLVVNEKYVQCDKFTIQNIEKLLFCIYCISILISQKSKLRLILLSTYFTI